MEMPMLMKKSDNHRVLACTTSTATTEVKSLFARFSSQELVVEATSQQASY